MKKAVLKRNIAIAFFVVLCLSVTSCRKKGCIDSNAENYDSTAKKDDGNCQYQSNVSIKFNHVVDTEPLTMNSGYYICWAGHEYNVSKLKYIISNVELQISGGETKAIDGVWVIDASNSINSSIDLGKVDNADYSGIAFTLGLNPSNNIDEVLTSASDMLWPDSLGGGYYFMKWEGQYDINNSNGTLVDYAIYLGSFEYQDVNQQTISQENHLEVGPIYAYATSGLSVENPTSVEYEVEFDLKWWLESPHTFDFTDYPYGTTTDMVAQQQLRENANEYVFKLNSLTFIE